MSADQVNAALEQEMVARGVQKYRKTIEAARKHSRESSTAYGQELIRMVMGRMVPALKDFCKPSKTRGGDHNSSAKPYLCLIDPGKAVFLTAKLVLDGYTEGYPLTALAIRIAGAIEDELRFLAWRRDPNPQLRNLYKKVYKDLMERQASVREAVSIHQPPKVVGEVRYLDLSEDDKLDEAHGRRPGASGRHLICLKPATGSTGSGRAAMLTRWTISCGSTGRSDVIPGSKPGSRTSPSRTG